MKQETRCHRVSFPKLSRSMKRLRLEKKLKMMILSLMSKTIPGKAQYEIHERTIQYGLESTVKNDDGKTKFFDFFFQKSTYIAVNNHLLCQLSFYND